ncbi:acyl-CoA reductase [Duganella fentianensis]|uniref:acyl-CoA reductase n=1 Tax=Duganella fentianensis TaxID=2692177 RepID=UPI0032B23A1C
MKLQFFLPARSEAESLEVLLQEAAARTVMTPFDPVLVRFVADFAKSILLDPAARAYPELIVLANFFKSGNIGKLQQELSGAPTAVFQGRGLVFHMAPSNVDSVFLYSSLLSLLCGNINLIRISRGAGPQIRFIIDKLARTLETAGLSERFFVFTYEHDDAITSLISSYCHLRVVWGGDATVNKIRALPLRPTASELCFPDRFSAAMLDAAAVCALAPEALAQLSTQFYNDTIWFSQQACSSPRLVAWIGSAEQGAAARERFWAAFAAQLAHKEYENSAGMVMDRFVAACMVATTPQHRATPALDFPTRILLENTPLSALKHYHCGNGLFYEQEFADVPAFFRTLSDREQTLSVFGYDGAQLAPHLAALPMRALDRITRIGHALDFSHVWDGGNLLQSFTRQIDIRL